MTRTNSLILALVAVLLWPMAANADPITWSGNGNSYQVVTGQETIDWATAKAMAEEAGGHLVTITSEAENNFVSDLLREFVGNNDPQSYWLGGYQTAPGTDRCEPDGCWAWVTGEAWEAWSFTNWEEGEPNNGVGGTQHYLHYWKEPGKWDDMDNRDIMTGYIIEYAAAIPEPGTLALLGFGLVGLAISRRKSI